MSSGMVRPFAMVGGRTRTAVPLALETLVITTDAGRTTDDASPVQRRLLELCESVHSVAEVAALLSVPLAVAKVLVSDAHLDGHVNVHRETTVSSAGFLEEVLDAFRAL